MLTLKILISFWPFLSITVGLSQVETLPPSLFLESLVPQRPVQYLPWSKHVCSSWINDCMPQYVIVPFFAILLESSCKAELSADAILKQLFLMMHSLARSVIDSFGNSYRISELPSLFSCVLGWMHGSIESSAGATCHRFNNGGAIYEVCVT